MEVYSGHKPVGSTVTAAATTVLIIIAVLQSISMAHQKRQRWFSLLDRQVQVDEQLSIKIPQTWRGALDDDRSTAMYLGSLGPDDTRWELRVERLQTRKFDSADGIYRHAFGQMLGIPPPAHLQRAPARECRLGDHPASVRSFHILSTDGQVHVAAVLAATHASMGTTILLLVGPGHAEAAATSLLLQIAASAEFSAAGRGREPRA